MRTDLAGIYVGCMSVLSLFLLKRENFVTLHNELLYALNQPGSKMYGEYFLVLLAGLCEHMHYCGSVVTGFINLFNEIKI